jgi:hypothetical protein
VRGIKKEVKGVKGDKEADIQDFTRTISQRKKGRRWSEMKIISRFRFET